MLNTVRKLILGLFAFGVVYAGAIQPVDAALQSRPLAKDHFRTPGDNVDGDESGFLTPHPEIFPMYPDGDDDIDSIVASGDINFDSNVNSIGDAVLFSNYLIYGMRVFTLDPAGQMNETDINHYGNPLTVANLVYLIRLVVGDAMPLDRVARITASVIIDNSVISVSDRMGAAYVVVEGNVVPELLVNTVDMKFAYDASQNVTRVLVVGMEKDASFTGSFLDANGPIVSIELATYDGASVRNITYPDRPHSLSQNYPNPFNAATEIRFRGWVDFDYTLTIYNVQGQIVETFKGYAQAGEVTVTWEAGDNASGAYFYRLESGHFSRTMKMVLRK